MHNALYKVLPPLIFGFAVISGWELLTIVTDADPRLYPAPSEVWSALLRNPEELLRNAKITGMEMVLGFALGAVLGVCIGVLLAFSKLIRSAVYPWLVVSQTIPIPAISAVLVIWFGFSTLPKILVVALITFFPIAVNTVDGLKAVDPEMVRLMRTFGASRSRIFREVRIPVAIPHIFTGMRVAAAFSVLGAVFGEWVGARGGLGYLLLLKNRAVNTDEVFAIIFVMAILGVGFFALIALVERLTIPWYHRARDEDVGS
jgi:ABC-type nitrate/sulfonate/bicarbonate transport system permease component